MDVNVLPSILKSRVILGVVVRATWRSTSYGCKLPSILKSRVIPVLW